MDYKNRKHYHRPFQNQIHPVVPLSLVYLGTGEAARDTHTNSLKAVIDAEGSKPIGMQESALMS